MGFILLVRRLDDFAFHFPHKKLRILHIRSRQSRLCFIVSLRQGGGSAADTTSMPLGCAVVLRFLE